MDIEYYRKRMGELYNRLDEIRDYEKECIAEQDRIIVSKPAKDITKRLKKLRDCSKYHEERITIKKEIKELYEERRKETLNNIFRGFRQS